MVKKRQKETLHQKWIFRSKIHTTQGKHKSHQNKPYFLKNIIFHKREKKIMMQFIENSWQVSLFYLNDSNHFDGAYQQAKRFYRFYKRVTISICASMWCIRVACIISNLHYWLVTTNWIHCDSVALTSIYCLQTLINSI